MKCRIALALQTSFTMLFIGNTLPEESILSVESLSSQLSDQRTRLHSGTRTLPILKFNRQSPRNPMDRIRGTGADCMSGDG